MYTRFKKYLFITKIIRRSKKNVWKTIFCPNLFLHQRNIFVVLSFKKKKKNTHIEQIKFEFVPKKHCSESISVLRLIVC